MEKFPNPEELKSLINLMKNHGVELEIVRTAENKFTNEDGIKILRCVYGYEVKNYSFEEHDQMLMDRIMELEEENDKLKALIVSMKPKEKEKIESKIVDACDLSENYTFDELVAKYNQLDNKYQQECIRINRLNTALDVMVEKYRRIMEIMEK
jgi:hypothetical protein